MTDAATGAAHEARVVTCDVLGAHARLTLRNPSHNRISNRVLDELSNHLDALEGRDDVQLVTVHAPEGSPFSLGADVAELVRARPAERIAFVRRTQDTFDRVAGLPQISVAVLEGSAIGGGFELALACDFRVASPGPHRFGLPEVSVGLLPAGGGMKRLVQLAGPGRAKLMVATGALMPSDEALRAGLLHLVGRPERAWAEECADFLSRLATTDGAALRALKKVLSAWEAEPAANRNQDELEAIQPLLHRPDLEQLLSPFM